MDVYGDIKEIKKSQSGYCTVIANIWEDGGNEILTIKLPGDGLDITNSAETARLRLLEIANAILVAFAEKGSLK